MTRADLLVVDSATGVEVALPVAGPGGRAFAFVIDWHIRLALALAWYGAGALAHSTLTRGSASLSVPFDPGPSWFLGVVLPAAAIFFLYHPFLEIVLRGRTPGKRFAGLRIVTREGNAPGIGALLVRNVFRLIDSFPGVYCVGLIATIVTPQSVRLGDLAAGTVLVYERAPLPPLPPAAAAPRAGAGGAPDAGVAARGGRATGLAALELAVELEARWEHLSTESRTRLAREMLGRLGEPGDTLDAADDPTLRRLLAHRVAGAAGAP